MRKIIQPNISFTIFWDFSMSYEIFLSPLVKRKPIITYKHATYELTWGVAERLKTWDLRKLENISKVSKLQGMIA